MGAALATLAVATAAVPEATPIRVLNRGIGGQTSREALARFAETVEAAPPQALVLYLGINDALNSAKLVGVDAFRTNLTAMVARARAAGVATVVLTTPNPFIEAYVRARHPQHPAADLTAHLALYEAVVREVAVANACLLADLKAAVERLGMPLDGHESVVRNLANSHAADGLHLTPAGYRLLGTLVAGLLADRVHPGDTVVCLGDSLTFGAGVEGAGTACGQTYPAWLWFCLNAPLGIAQGDRPPPAGPRAAETGP